MHENCRKGARVMKRRRIILFSIVAVAVSCVAVVVINRMRQPQYHGKPINGWLNLLAKGTASSDGKVIKKAQEAISNIGPAAAPFIVSKLKSSDSWFHRRYRTLYVKLPGWIKEAVPQPAVEFNVGDGERAFFWMGPNSMPAFVHALKQANVNVRTAVVMAMGQVQVRSRADVSPALPELIECLSESDPYLLVYTLQVLAGLGPRAAPAVPALIPTLSTSEVGREPGSRVSVRAAAAQALGSIGPGASNALPVLRPLLNDLDAFRRIVAAASIWRICGDASNTVPVLIRGVREASSPPVARIAVRVLGEMGPQAKDAVPALLEILSSDARLQQLDPQPNELRREITNALSKINPDAALEPGVATHERHSTQ